MGATFTVAQPLNSPKQGKRGGETPRQRTQICENTPDASGNVWNELERITDKIHTKEYVET